MKQSVDHVRKYYVYVYFNRNGRPLYVGKGCGNRWLQHMRMTEAAKKLSNGLLRREIIAAGGSLPVVKIAENLTSEEAVDIEIAFIKALGRGRTGILVNGTDGGEGWRGVVRTPEHNAKIAAARKGKPLSVEQRAAMRERCAKTEWREARRESAKRQHAGMTEEQRAARSQRISQSVREAMTPEVCAKISARKTGVSTPPNCGNKGQKWTDERRARQTQAIEARKARGWHSSETAAKISAAHQRRYEALGDGATRSSRWRWNRRFAARNSAD